MVKLFLYDKFFDAFSEMPRNIQKKTRDFMKKFKENPKSSAINYEKISTFKDPQLRTVRIDLTYRAIVHEPVQGDHYHLLWVDHHDKAMDWARNKIFEWNRETQAYQVMHVPDKEDAPVSQAKPADTATGPFTAYKDRELLRLGVPQVMLESIKGVQDLDELEKWEDYLPKEVFEQLFYLLDGIDISILINEIEQGRVQAETEAEAANSPNNQRSFYLVTDDDDLERVLSGDLRKWQVFLHPSQSALVQGDFKGPTKVTGGAGTGKTVAALHRAKFLQDGGLFPSDKPIFFTTYTRRLVENLKSHFKALDLDPQKVHLQNFHAFLIDFARTHQVIPSETNIVDFWPLRTQLQLWDEILDFKVTRFSADFVRDEYLEVILAQQVDSLATYLRTTRTGRTSQIGRKDRTVLWEIIEAYRKAQAPRGNLFLDEIIVRLNAFLDANPEKQPFSHGIADEIQDFSVLELSLLRRLVPETANDLFLVGDPLQKVYRKYTNFSQAGINIRGRRSKRLKVNYRTTEEIRRIAVSVIREVEFEDFDGESESKKGYISLMHGNQPQYKVFATRTEELQTITDAIESLLQNDNLRPEQIVVASHTHEELKSLKGSLNRSLLPFFELGDGAGKPDENAIRLSTFHNLKGLEFRAVILMGISKSSFPLRPQAYQNWSAKEKHDHDNREKALLYVAMTRAIEFLMLTGVGEASDKIVL